jgi:phosphate:Na+ symporter
MNSMAKKARKNINRAFGLLTDFSQEKYNKVQEKENLIDQYEDKLGTYLMQLTGHEMTMSQTTQVSKFLHTISDFERLGDHAVNISNVAAELDEKKSEFSEYAQNDLAVLEDAAREIVDLTVTAFCDDDLKMAARVEPLRELIGMLCSECKNRHVTRLREGKCGLKQSFAFNDMLTNFERIAAHCSNVAAAMIELEVADFDTHEYLRSVRQMKNDQYMECFEEYAKKYMITPLKKEPAPKEPEKKEPVKKETAKKAPSRKKKKK